MTIEQGKRIGIDRFPNFHKSGSIRGMKHSYYGKNCLLIQCGYLQPIITQYFIDNKSEIWLLFLIAHSKR